MWLLFIIWEIVVLYHKVLEEVSVSVGVWTCSGTDHKKTYPGGGGCHTKKIFAHGKIQWKKNSCMPINPKKYSWYGLKKFIQGIW